jgi:hypothetical protein
MPKLTFSPEALRKSLSVMKLVKPMSGFYVLKVESGTLSMFSSDRRRFARAEVQASSSDLPDGFVSDEYFLPADRQSFLETDLDSVSFILAEKGLTVKTEGAGQSRQAAIKRRGELSKHPPMPARPKLSGTLVNGARFEELIRQVSCSALVKETKTDEDMRVNQVHFYPSESCAVANARFYATIAFLPGLNLDVSIVSADLPAIRSFSGRLGGDSLSVSTDKSHLYVSDPASGSFVAFSRYSCPRPPLEIIPDDGHPVVMSVDRDQLVKSLSWCSMAVEGTQRITVDASDGRMSLLNGKSEVSHLPVRFERGESLKADFPAKTMFGIVKYLGEGPALLKYGQPSSPTTLEIAEESPDGDVRARHFVSSMKERK